jgi:hypothetical protein
MNKCEFPGGIDIRPDGVTSLDPCLYKLVEEYRNVTVKVYKCIHCGHVDVSWERQDNTIDISVEE